jgi:methyl-accepting chemotaxis protein
MQIITRVKIIVLASVAAVAVVAGSGWYGLSVSEASINDLATNQIPSILTVNDAAQNFAALRTDLLQHILATDDAATEAAERGLREHGTALRDALDEYESLVSDEEDGRLLKVVEARINAYQEASEEILVLSRSGQDVEAKSRNGSELMPLADAAFAALQDHVRYNVEAAEASHQSVSATANTLYLQLAGAFVCATVLMGALGFGLYKRVVSPLEEARNLISDISRKLDFTVRAEVKTQDELGQLLTAFNSLLNRLQESLSEIKAGAHELGASATQLSAAANQVSNQSVGQSESASSMASTIEEMTVSISHVAERAADATDQAGEAARLAREGYTLMSQSAGDMREMVAAVEGVAGHIRELESLGRQIAGVVSVIKAVAEQTNLLALNAAIEAARAGEQGRGFAVVADEVRSLAWRTAGSTQEITDMVAAIQAGADKAVARMDETMARVQRSVEDALKTHSAMDSIRLASEVGGNAIDEIAVAIRQQSTASNEMAAAVDSIAQMSQVNSKEAQRAAQLAFGLDELAKRMSAVVQNYHL